MKQELNSDHVWHPFTQMKLAAPPIQIARAKDAILYAADGKEYIDAISSWWVNIHGHANPIIAKQIAQQALELEQVIFAGFTHRPAMELATNLVQALPSGFSKVFYSDNGSTSVEVAIKICLQYWHNQGKRNKTKIIAFKNAYHGDTFGAMSVGSKSKFNAAFENHLFEVEHIAVPSDENLLSLSAHFKKLLSTGDIAAFIFEPLVQGAGGMLMHKPEHLDALIRMARDQNVLCIADEVMTGFGRTGHSFAIEYLEHKPDIICLSKGITGGFMPLGVTVCTKAVYEAFHSDDIEKTFFHGHSYTANPLACAAAIASLNILQSEDCQQRIRKISKSHARFAESMQGLSSVLELRHRGTIVAIEFATIEVSSYFNSIRNELYDFALSKGVLLRPLGNVIYIMPPYCISETELEKVYSVIREMPVIFKSKLR